MGIEGLGVKQLVVEKGRSVEIVMGNSLLVGKKKWEAHTEKVVEAGNTVDTVGSRAGGGCTWGWVLQCLGTVRVGSEMVDELIAGADQYCKLGVEVRLLVCELVLQKQLPLGAVEVEVVHVWRVVHLMCVWLHVRTQHWPVGRLRLEIERQ